VKILREGKLPEERVWEGTCTICGTLAECRERELKVTHDQRDGTSGSAACPLCKKPMTFYPKER
jgi:hypothetical protein